MPLYRPGASETVINGIVLSASTLFESDRRVELLTETHGRITLLAKGAMSSVKRFGGRLEPTTLIGVSCRIKPGMWRMTDATIIQAFARIRTSYDAIAGAIYIIELVRKVTVDGQPHHGLYQWLRSALSAIDRAPSDVRSIQCAFERALLELEGVCPESFVRGQFMTIFSEYTGQWVNPPGYIGARD